MGNKSGEMGMGLLIVLIAFLVVAAITAGVILSSAESLRSSALNTFKDARDKSTNFIQMIMIDGQDGTTGRLNDFTTQIRLLPGSGSLSLNDTMVIFRNRNDTALITLNPNGLDGNLTNDGSGFQTFRPVEFSDVQVWNDTLTQGLAPRISDLAATCTAALGCINTDFDDDGVVDTIRTCCDSVGCPVSVNQTHLRVDMSTAGSAYVPLYQPTGALVSTDLCTATPITIFNNMTPIVLDNVTYGYIHIDVTTVNDNAVDCGGCTGSQGAYAFRAAEVIPDVNLDGKTDYLAVNDTHILIWLSTATIDRQYLVEHRINDSAEWVDVGNELRVNAIVSHGSAALGRIVLEGAVAQQGQIPSNATFYFEPEKKYRGWYAAEALLEGEEYRSGFISQGDVLRLYFQSPEPVDGTDEITIGLISQNHEYYATKSIDMQEFESTQRVIVYP